LDTSRAQETMR